MTPFLWGRLVCVFKGHDMPEKSAVEIFAAVYHGGICLRCKRVYQGEFICNSWDDSQTTEHSWGTAYSGMNPILCSGEYMVIPWDVAEQLSETLLYPERYQESDDDYVA